MVRDTKYSYKQWANRKFCSNSCRRKANPSSKETRLKVSRAMSGDRNPMKQLVNRLKLSGKNSHWWKGGITPINQLLRRRMEFQDWRKDIFKRDDYTCQICGERGCELNADHIKPFAYYPELRYDLNNGRTLCVLCHKNTPDYGNKARLLYEK